MADINNKIKTTVELDTGQARSEIVKLNTDATKSQEKFSNSIEESKDVLKEFDGVTGGLNSKFGAFKSGLSSVAAGFKTVGGAIALSGIGLLVITLAALKAAFTRSEEGQNKFAKIMGIIGAVTGQFLDLLADLGEKIIGVFENPQQSIKAFANLIKQNIVNRFQGLLELVPKIGQAISLVFKGEFTEAGKVAVDAIGKVTLGMNSVTDSISNATEAIKGFVAETSKEAAAAARIADLRAKADKVERGLIVARAKADRDREALKEKAIDSEKYTLAERIKFLEQASALEIKITNQEIYAASLRLKAKQAENALGKSTKEDLIEEADLKAKIIQLEQARLAKQTEVTGQVIALRQSEKDLEAKIAAEAEARRLKKLEDDAKAEEKRLADLAKDEELRRAEEDRQIELDALEIERKAMKGEDTLALELALLERKRLQDISAADIAASEIQAINEKAAIEKDKLNKASLEAERARDAAVLDSALNGAAEAFGVAQEVAVAKMIMAAPEAIAGSFKMAAQTYAPPVSYAMGALGAATTVIPIIKGLADIKKARFPGKKKGGGGGSSGGTIATPPGGGSTGITPEVVSNLAANNSARVGGDTSIGDRATSAAANNVLGGATGRVVFSESKYSDFRNQVSFKEERTTM